MLREQVREHIVSLADAELVEYSTVGQRMYEPEAVAFAREELARRKLSPEVVERLRALAVAKLLQSDPRLQVGPMGVCQAVVCARCGVEAPSGPQGKP